MTTPIKVEQVDRDAAADLWLHQVISQHGAHASWMEDVVRSFKKGKRDDEKIVQAFARHRIAAEAKTREEDARIAEEEAGEAGYYQNPEWAGAAARIATAIRSRMETDNGR